MSSLMSRLAAAPRPAVLFGLAGLLPFIGLTLQATVGPAEAHTTALVALLQYSALIATFVGALHWGYAVAGVNSPASSALRYGWSVAPSLLAWAALQQPLQLGLRLVGALLMLCYLVDRQLLRPGSLPSWIADLRLLLTGVAVLSLALASIG